MGALELLKELTSVLGIMAKEREYRKDDKVEALVEEGKSKGKQRFQTSGRNSRPAEEHGDRVARHTTRG